MGIQTIRTDKFGPGGTEFIELREVAAARRPACTDNAMEAISLPSSPDNPEEAISRRRQFWADTCREPGVHRSKAKAVGELHRKHGWRFCTPSAEQVQQILDTLDATEDGWEGESPERFFEELEANFPELQKYRARAAVRAAAR